jgi:hypothetical protein
MAMEICSFELEGALYPAKQHYIPQDENLQFRCCENLKLCRSLKVSVLQECINSLDCKMQGKKQEMLVQKLAEVNQRNIGCVGIRCLDLAK